MENLIIKLKLQEYLKDELNQRVDTILWGILIVLFFSIFVDYLFIHRLWINFLLAKAIIITSLYTLTKIKDKINISQELLLHIILFIFTFLCLFLLGQEQGTARIIYINLLIIVIVSINSYIIWDSINSLFYFGILSITFFLFSYFSIIQDFNNILNNGGFLFFTIVLISSYFPKVKKEMVKESLLIQIEYESRIEEVTSQLLEAKNQIRLSHKKNEILIDKYKQVIDAFKYNIKELKNKTISQENVPNVNSTLTQDVNDLYLKSTILLDKYNINSIVFDYGLELEPLNLVEYLNQHIQQFNNSFLEKHTITHIQTSSQHMLVNANTNALNFALHSLILYIINHINNHQNLFFELTSTNKKTILQIQTNSSVATPKEIETDVLYGNPKNDLKFIKLLIEEMNADFKYGSSEQMGLKFIIQFKKHNNSL
ncbi:hypothetical protein FHR24_001118 [Wenyingzhuangia heitensis]|uniref:Signal transduction histidine kinase n=1 Tax=Wenyingzhuangia heitensis TaxID=1487859 RepID=A0ABX0U8K9_9FLAO|nr:hypothetical protein [Wenyingzhuangia heitensis]NIJ44679.1 hypothetical protein [Wenyingzhuangia heitensis]